MITAIITDVTRMRAPNVCVAGRCDARTIRLNNPQPTESLLATMGGLGPGDVLALDWRPGRIISRPHVEDGDWRIDSVTKLRRTSDEEFSRLLSDSALADAEEAFGKPWFIGSQGNGAFRPGHGRRSLATINAHDVRVYLHFDGVRVDFADERGAWTKVPLEDLTVRQHQTSCRSCATAMWHTLRDEFECDRAILRIGLTRPFQTPQHPTACWLQVTGVYPIGRRRKHFLWRSYE